MLLDQPPLRRLYISDLDGTLLLPDKTLGQRSRAVLKRFIAGGGLFTIATGRSTASAQQILAGVDFPVEAILHNGALTAPLGSGVASCLSPMPGQLARQLFQRAIALGLAPLAYAIDEEGRTIVLQGGVANEPTQGYLESVMPLHACHRDDGARLSALQSLTIIILDEPGRLANLFAELCGEGSALSASLSQSAYTPGLGVGEVQAAGASKANAAEQLARRCELGPHEIVAFGDNANDLPLLRLAGYALCPPSAIPEVLALTPHRIAPPAAEGVASFLEALLERAS